MGSLFLSESSCGKRVARRNGGELLATDFRDFFCCSYYYHSKPTFNPTFESSWLPPSPARFGWASACAQWGLIATNAIGHVGYDAICAIS